MKYAEFAHRTLLEGPIPTQKDAQDEYTRWNQDPYGRGKSRYGKHAALGAAAGIAKVSPGFTTPAMHSAIDKYGGKLATSMGKRYPGVGGAIETGKEFFGKSMQAAGEGATRLGAGFLGKPGRALGLGAAGAGRVGLAGAGIAGGAALGMGLHAFGRLREKNKFLRTQALTPVRNQAIKDRQRTMGPNMR